MADVGSALRTLRAGRTEMVIYRASGRRKHERWFGLDADSLQLSWSKSARGKAHKSERLVRVIPDAAVPDARALFDETDADGSGELDASEVAQLYRKARGQKLGKSDLKAAMAQMDSDGDGRVDFAEFARWWSTNGGDLEAQRSRALTLVCGDAAQEVIVVAADETLKRHVSAAAPFASLKPQRSGCTVGRRLQHATRGRCAACPRLKSRRAGRPLIKVFALVALLCWLALSVGSRSRRQGYGLAHSIPRHR